MPGLTGDDRTSILNASDMETGWRHAGVVRWDSGGQPLTEPKLCGQAASTRSVRFRFANFTAFFIHCIRTNLFPFVLGVQHCHSGTITSDGHSAHRFVLPSLVAPGSLGHCRRIAHFANAPLCQVSRKLWR